MPSINPVENFNFGIFGLNDVRTSIVTAVPTAVGVGTTTNINSTVFVDVTNWSQESSHGWFGAGTPGPFSTVDRIDFSNDSATASVRGPLSSVRYGVTATGNSNYGWFGGGKVSGVPVSTVDRIDFSNDFVTASVKGLFLDGRSNVGSTGNSNYGWFGNGTIGNPVSGTNVTTRVDRIDFSNDSSTASVRGPLSLARSNLAATGNSNYGWFGGGVAPASTPSTVSTVDRIDFSNDFSTASVRGPLSLEKFLLAATGNSNYGWFGGGQNASFTLISSVDRIDFSNDSSTASVRGPLSEIKDRSAATGNSNYGWFGGGFQVSTVNRIDFSNDSVTASVRGLLSAAKGYLGATSGQAKSSSIRPGRNLGYGWFGGSGPAPAAISTVDRIDFSNDSATASVRGSLTLSRSRGAATGNSNYGWWGGGTPNPLSLPIERIDFSNDSATASVRGSLSVIRRLLVATGNSNYGWFGGGYIFPTPLSTVDRIDFSNDSVRVSVRGPLSAARYNLAATGNSNYGWFGGGQVSTGPIIRTIVDRIDFSNDSVRVSVRGPLREPNRLNVAATGNSNYGWFGGGIPLTVERIDFSNDSSTASVRGPLSLARTNSAATGNSNYGWFGGGAPLPALSSVDRIDFSNDLPTASVRGPLSGGRYYHSATSNTPIG